jgi:hypothetical protein
MMYKDLSSYYGVVDNINITCEDDSAVLNGFINMLNTSKDLDGISERVFRPNLGTNLLRLLNDPIDDITAFQIKLELTQLGSQLDRARLIPDETTITPNHEDGCFEIKLVLKNMVTGNKISGFFNLNKS